MKKTKLTQNKNRYISFEEVVSNSLKDLFHHKSSNRLFDYKELHLIKPKEIKKFFGSLIDQKELQRQLHLFNFSDLRLFNKKELMLVNTKELQMIDMKMLAGYLNKVGLVSTMFIVYLGVLFAYISMAFSPEELRAQIIVNRTQAHVQKMQHLAKVETTEVVTAKAPHYLAYVKSQEVSRGMVAGVNTINEETTTLVKAEDTSFSNCSFKADQKKFYTSDSTVYLKKGETVTLCVTDASGNNLKANWLMGSSESVSSNCVAFSADSVSSTSVNLTDQNSTVVKSCTLSFGLK